MCTWESRGVVQLERTAHTCILGCPCDVVAIDVVVLTLGEESVGVPQGSRGMYVVDGDRGVGPLVDGMSRGGGFVRVGILPPDLGCVVEVDKHDIGRGSATPRVATHTGMPILFGPRLLKRPILIAMTPTELLEGFVITGVPHVHANVGVTIRDI